MAVKSAAGSWVWILTGIVSITLSILFFLPASWLGALLEKQTQGRLSLGDVQGSFWRGSAFVGVASGVSGPVTPLFAGRFAWKISPLILLAQVEAELDNPESLSAIVKIQGNFSELQVSPASLLLPTERLEGLGAPLNTIGPTGKLRMSWNNLRFARDAGRLNGYGQLQLELSEMASRLSPVKPLGSYNMAFDLRRKCRSASEYLKGPMMLAGSGTLNGGHFSFRAWAEEGQQARLANLLNLLGQP
jgi:general secretion pathway protein N